MRRAILGLVIQGLAAALAFATPSLAAEVRFPPGVPALLLSEAGPNGVQDMVVPAVGLVTGPREQFELKRLTIQLCLDGRVVASEVVSADRLVADTRMLGSAPVPGFQIGQLLAPDGVSGFARRPVALAGSASMQPNQLLVLARRYFAVSQPVNAMRVIFEGRDGSRPVKAVGLIAVLPYRSPISYSAPLDGLWLMQAGPVLQSHHRFNPPTEFAIDFFRIDDQGRLSPSGATSADAAYGWGAPVLAAADGVVVTVLDGAVQDRSNYARRPDETAQQAGARIEAFNLQRMQSDFARATAGNLVVLRHERAGVVEYTSYGHLRSGIPVRVGDRVVQGQPIGFVGDTGDSAAVHLHFQANAGRDPFASQSLPVKLVDLRNVAGNADLGRLVALGAQQPPPAGTARAQ